MIHGTLDRVTPQASPNRSTITWLIPIVMLIAVAALVGGLIARQFYAASQPPSGSPSTPDPNPTTSTPPSGPQNPLTVAFTAEAKNHPMFVQAQQTIQTYFNSFNDHHFNEWQSAVTPREAATQTSEGWERGSSSSKDGDLVVYRLDTTPVGVDAFVTFQSNQRADQSPDGKSTCLNWWMVWEMVTTKSGGLLIDGVNPRYQPC